MAQAFVKEKRNEHAVVDQRNGGRVVDITDGGDAREAKVVVDGLEGPASILPLEDRILIAETWAGRVASVVEGQRTEYFATGLSWPYSLAALSKNGYRRIVVSEHIGLMRGQITDITSGGARDAFVPYVTDVPYPTPITYKAPGSELANLCPVQPRWRGHVCMFLW